MLLDSLRRRANARNTSFRISLQWPIHIVNPVDKTKLSMLLEVQKLSFSYSRGRAARFYL